MYLSQYISYLIKLWNHAYYTNRISFQEGDRFALVCSGCEYCETCTVDRPDNIPTCLAAMEHSNSPGGNLVTLETLSIEEGY